MNTTTQAPDDAIPDDLVEMRAAAKLAKANIATLHRWRLSGRLRAWKRAGRYFVSRAEVLAQFRPVTPRQRVRDLPREQRPRTRQQVEAETTRILREAGMRW